MVTTQKQQLAFELAAAGWHIAEREANDLDWWADEIWAIESTWHPVAFRLFLTILVDPMHGGPRRKNEAVWAVGTSTTWPEGRREAGGEPTLSLGAGWADRLPEYLEGLKTLRDEAV